MKAKFALIFILSLVLIQSVYALGISPPKIEVPYEPGAQYTFSFTIYGESMSSVDVIKKGNLADYIIIRQIDSNSNSFTIDFTVPQLQVPGLHRTYVGVQEHVPEGVGLAARVAVFATIDVRVPYPGKWLDATLEASNVKVGEQAKFTAKLVSRGQQVISNVGGSVAILDPSNRTVATVPLSSAQNIQPEQEFELVGQWDTTNALPSPYTAIATINYDESSVQAQRNFNVGDILLEILKIDAPNITQGEIGKINIGIKSKWNEPIENVRGDVQIKNGGQILATMNTPTITVPAWDSKTLDVYWDTSNVATGQYDAVAKIYYANKTAEADFKIAVVEKVQKAFATGTENMIISALVILLLILALAYYRKRKKRRSYYRW